MRRVFLAYCIFGLSLAHESPIAFILGVSQKKLIKQLSEREGLLPHLFGMLFLTIWISSLSGIVNHICHFKKKDYLGLLLRTCKSLSKDVYELTLVNKRCEGRLFKKVICSSIFDWLCILHFTLNRKFVGEYTHLYEYIRGSLLLLFFIKNIMILLLTLCGF